MRKFDKEVLQGTINRTLDDTMNSAIRAGLLAAGGAGNWSEIRRCLKQWESEGILKILNDPEGLPSSAPCVQMLKYIHKKSPIPGFLNWEEP